MTQILEPFIEHRQGYTISGGYDPDGDWPARWESKVYHGEKALPYEYCKTIYAVTRRRALSKARRYVDRRHARLLKRLEKS